MAFSRTAPLSPFKIQVFLPEMVCRCMGKPLFPQNRLAIQTFGREKVCRGKKNSSIGENPFAIQGFGPEMVCRGMGKPLFPQNLLAIQTFGRGKVCRGKKNSSMGENMFAIQGFGPEMVCRCMGKPLFRKTCSRYRLLDGKRCVAARKTAQSAKTRSRLVNGDELELEDS